MTENVISLEDLNNLSVTDFENGNRFFTYKTNCSLSLITKKKVKNTTRSWRKIDGKLRINFEREFTKEFVALVTKEWTMDPISAENFSDAKDEGKIALRGVTKSICCEAR